MNDEERTQAERGQQTQAQTRTQSERGRHLSMIELVRIGRDVGCEQRRSVLAIEMAMTGRGEKEMRLEWTKFSVRGLSGSCLGKSR